MNKTAIKKFAIEARNKLRASVTVKAGMLGITEKECSSPIMKGTDFEIYKTAAGTEVTLNRSQCEQRRKLVDQINARGFDTVIEEVAYTWFNRICAIRFMEVNDYLPSRVRVLSSEKDGKTEPDIVTQAPDVDLDFTDKEREFILDAKMSNKSDELFRMLFIKQCNKLSEILPELFEATEDYTEMLLNISYTNEDDIVRMLVGDDGIPEKDFNVSAKDEEGNFTGQVEIIGWLYQYYNTELKDDTFAKLKKNIKISKERIPAATQLFTPDWIVRYMVENSVGRLWIEHLRANDSNVDEKQVAEDFGWKYYLPEAEQEDDVNIKLAEIRTTYKDLKPEDITCIDPCMGSGHILIAMFDVLMDIYKSAGYSERDAAFLIVENNIHGLDIDKRAYQLAYFAVMMKGRGYNRRFFSGKQNEDGERVAVKPQVYVIEESNGVNRAQLKYFGADLSETEKNEALKQMNELLDELRDATEYGSILNISNYNWDLLRRFVEKEAADGQMNFEILGIDETKNRLDRLVKIGKVMAQKYDVVVTNPPYKGKSDLNNKLAQFIDYHYENSKKDLFAVFIEKCMKLCRKNGFQAMITQQAWMFEDYEQLRKIVLMNQMINCIQLGAHAFDEIPGEIVKTVTFVLRRTHISCNAIYMKLTECKGEENKKIAYFNRKYCYTFNSAKFEEIPEHIFAYWLGRNAIKIFNTCKPIKHVLRPKQGTSTGNDEKYVRYWFEIDNTMFNRKCNSAREHWNSGLIYVPLDKGGEYRKWYGNNDRVIRFDEISYRELLQIGNHLPSKDFYFMSGLTWSKIASNISVRFDDKGFVFSSVGLKGFPEHKYLEVLGYMNSCVCKYFSKVLSPGISIVSGDIEKLPYLEPKDSCTIKKYVNDLIMISKIDWDSFETSWDFQKHPLLCFVPYNKYTEIPMNYSIAFAFDSWSKKCDERFYQLKANEEELNRIFIDIYGLQDELTPEVEEKDVTVRKADLQRDIKSLLSYAVGCMFGRYSLDVDGLAYAGGDWDSTKYTSFIPDADNIIPITDEEYFSDDIVGRFCEWLKVVYGEDTLEENLDFIAQTLGNKGDTSREVIRNYFLNDFIKDHIKIYQKRPIYWLFDSGKANGFKALIYMHRYNPDTVGTVRTEYLHKTQKAIEQAMERATYISSNGSGSEKAKATKQITKYTKQLAEIHTYDEAMAHIANQRIIIDLDDGVKVNYEKFQGVEVSQEGKKSLKVDLLAKIK